ncbi:uncharacterized protein ATC70_004576 [Mucor velutinosus]|uniref:Uncharacterized protein n=1 Tax=Mucor velutinosus TaxID=708070 RepID=A0AAN7I4V1_9FUNG|nr:hypothetical protein ATC70_004576 [Mucor velutinosus]
MSPSATSVARVATSALPALFCNEEETTFEEALDEYESSKKAIEEPNTANAQRRTRENNQEKRHRSTPTIHDVVEQQLQHQAAAAAAQPANKQKGSTGRPRRSSTTEAMDVDPKALQRTPQSSYASKHAPLDVSLHMHVDSQGSSAANADFSSDVLPLCRHSVSSTSMSQTPVYHAAHRA